MNVLVAYASRHGATAEIAERIAETLGTAGLEATAVPVEEAEDVAAYDAVVLGAAAYMFHWLKPAVRFAHRHHRELSDRPAWLFSSGPLGTETVDAKGQDVVAASRPKEFDELVELLHPRGVQVFFGAYDPRAEPVGVAERLVHRMPAAKDSLPTGDFRDWAAIEEWARGIAAELVPGPETETAGPAD